MDDLLLLFYGNDNSAIVMKKSLDIFYDFTGVLANPSKSYLFLAGVDDEASSLIRQALPFKIGTFPLKYLRIPLVTSKLKKGDCT